MLTRRTVFGAAFGSMLAAPAVLRAQVAVTGDIATILAGVSDFSRFVEIAQRAGEIDRLKGTQALTVFAPTNAAFDRMPAGLLQDLLGQSQGSQAGSPDQFRLKALVTHHIVAGVVTVQTMRGGQRDIPSLNGGLVRLDGTGSVPTIAVARPSGGPSSNFGTGVGGQNVQPPARIVLADVLASNGVVQGIDHVLLP
ncbi:fasciclin domain protein [Acetobacteraceae bacterium AT-5844]|nr:fasciclin domain protein [Acetobacteraceae bacterium AT-5844]